MVKILFKNLPDTTTPVNADNLNAIQTNTENAINEVDGNIDLATKTLLSTTSGKNQEITGCAGASGKINIESGETYQAQYEGNQLVDFSNFPTTTGNTSYTFINNILNVSCTSGQYRYIGQDITNLFKNNPNKKIKFNYENIDVSEQYGTVCQLVIKKSDTTTSYAVLVNHELSDISYTIPNDTSDIDEVSFRIYPNNSSTSQAASVAITKPMVFFMEGTTIKPYEPYTNLLPAPSPDYPQDIVNVGSNINLFDKDNATTLNANLNNESTISGANINNRTLYIPCKANTTYTISKMISNDSNNTFVVGTTTTTPTNNGSYSQRISKTNEKNITITTNESAKYLLVWYWNNGNTLTETQARNSIKIEEGDKATGYTKYNIGGASYAVHNKNLWGGFNQPYTRTGSGVTFITNTNGTIFANGTTTNVTQSTTASNAISSGIYVTLKAGTYKVSCSTATSSKSIQILNESGTLIDTVQGTAKTITLSADQIIILRLALANNITCTNETFNIQLEKGSTATIYVEHKDCVHTIPLPTGMEFCKIRTYKDYPYKKDGKWYKHKEIEKYIFDGTIQPTSIYTSSSSDNVFAFQNLITNYLRNNTNICKCTHFISRGNSGYSDLTEGKCCFRYVSSDAGMYFYMSMNDYSTKGDFATWLATQYSNGTPVKVYYILATPVEEEITDKDTIYYLEHFPIYKEYTSIECINEVKPDMHIDYLYDNEVNNYWGAELDSLAEKLHNLEVGE